MSEWNVLTGSNRPCELEHVFLAGHKYLDCPRGGDAIIFRCVIPALRRIESDAYEDRTIEEKLTEHEMSEYTWTHWMRAPEHPDA